MSSKLVQQQIAKFLARADPEVLCVRGHWGVGKTFTWQTELARAQKEESVALSRYSYVSLFGLNSLDDLKYAIFENVISVSDGIKPASIETLDKFVNLNVVEWRRWTRIAQHIPVVNRFVNRDIVALSSFLTIRNQIICIDDIERSGVGLRPGDMLGLCSFLKEQRSCKVIIILNDERLEGEERKAFNKHLEKVADISLVYEPLPLHCATIAITAQDANSTLLRDSCVALGLTNIRVMRRAARFVTELSGILSGMHSAVLTSAIKSVPLFCWAVDEPGEAPSVDYLFAKSSSKAFTDTDREVPEDEQQWDAITAAYGYHWTDELDAQILLGIKKGYFDEAAILPPAKKLDEQSVANDTDRAFNESWDRFHNSFADDERQVLDDMFAAFMRHAKYISSTNLNGTVSLFKELGRTEQAMTMLAEFMATHDDPEIFDLEENPFGENVTDPDIKEAFERRLQEPRAAFDFAGVLESISNSWSPDDLDRLAEAPVDDYYAAFKGNSGKRLRQLLKNALRHDRVVNASEPAKAIVAKAREALRRIGGESPINARRVRLYGIRIEKAAGTEQTRA